MSSVTTYAGAIDFARYHLGKELWLGLAGSNLTWSGDPPYPSPNINSLLDLRGLLYVDIKRIVKPDPIGSIVTSTGKYSPVDPNEDTQVLVSTNSYYLYLEATILSNSILNGETFRIVSLVANAFFNTSLPTLNKGVFMDVSTITDYDVLWINTVEAFTVTNNLKRLQIVRRL